MPSDKIRVLIVDDSTLMREALKYILEKDPSIEVVGMAANGKEGVAKALALKPAVITMDLKMPIMSGIEAIEEIMLELPTPIIVISTLDVPVIMAALEIGAMDFIAVTGDIETISGDLVQKVRIASKVRPIRRYRPRPVIPPCSKSSVPQKRANKVIAIGVSTGGPQALEVVLSTLPRDFRGAILVVQHMSKGFIGGLAEWLNTSSHLDVRVAKAGDVLSAGAVLLAPDDYHVTIDKDNVILLKEPSGKHAHVPSIDVMMASVAEICGANAVGVLMTGMGSDGVDGMKSIKRRGGRTIVQDQESSVVYGMNKCAVDSGCADVVVPLARIAEEIIRCL
jgi:two-component system chemotaxis response regulator CheB